MTALSDLASPATGATGTLVLVVLMILRGLLIPRKIHEERVSDKDKQIDLWRTAWEKSEEAARIQRDQLSMYLELARTTTAVMQAIPSANEQGRHDVAAQTQD